MQLTRFDRWLRSRFVHETHVYTLRPAARVPAGIRHEELPAAAGKRYRHRYIAHRPEHAQALIEQLKEDSQMFATRVVDRKAWFVPYLAPKERSVTWWIAWKVVAIVAGIFILAWVKARWDDPNMRANILDALKVLNN
jgi:hypothetical protein